MSLEPIEPVFPGRDVRTKPIVGIPKSFRPERTCAYAARLGGRNEPSLLENSNMFQQRWQTDFKGLGELADGSVSAA